MPDDVTNIKALCYNLIKLTDRRGKILNTYCCQGGRALGMEYQNNGLKIKFSVMLWTNGSGRYTVDVQKNNELVLKAEGEINGRSFEYGNLREPTVAQYVSGDWEREVGN